MTTTPLAGMPVALVQRQIENVFAIVRGASGQELYGLDIVPLDPGGGDRIRFRIHRTTPIDQIILAAPQFPQCITAELMGGGEEEGGHQEIIKKLWVRVQTPLYPEEAIERVFAPWEQELLHAEQLDEYLLLHLAPALSAIKTVRRLVQDNPDWVLNKLPERSREEGWAKVVESVHRIITITPEPDRFTGRLVFVVRNANKGVHITMGVNAKLYPVLLQADEEEIPILRFVEPLLQHMLQRKGVVEPGSDPSRYLEHAGFIKHKLEAPTSMHPTTQAVLEFIFNRPEFEDEVGDDDDIHAIEP